MKTNSGKTIAKYGLLIALALIFSYVEALVPAFFAVPGMKLGLANVVVIVALYLIDIKGAIIINISRILLVAILFGNGMSLAFSIAGGCLSLVVMIILKLTGKVKLVTVSICGGISHNVGQILVAIAVLQTTSLAWYLLVLWFTGIATGIVIGVISSELIKRLKKVVR